MIQMDAKKKKKNWPSIEYNGWQKIYEEKIFTEDQKAWAFSITNQQDDNTSRQPLQPFKMILISYLKFINSLIKIIYRKTLTINKAVMDSFIHRFSSKRWPSTIQAQRSATKRLSETTEAWSEVDNEGILDTKESKNDAIIVIFLYREPPQVSLCLFSQNAIAQSMCDNEVIQTSTSIQRFRHGSANRKN